MLGVDHDNATGWSLTAFAIPEHKRRILNHLLMVRKTREPVRTDVTLRARNGSSISCQLVTRSHSADGMTFRTAILDLTDRRHMEEALRTTERRLSAAVAASGLGIFELEIPFQGLLYLNHHLAEILGHPRSELAEPLGDPGLDRNPSSPGGWGAPARGVPGDFLAQARFVPGRRALPAQGRSVALAPHLGRIKFRDGGCFEHRFGRCGDGRYA